MRRQSGFTLIELLIVIAVIGVLASIIMVSLSNAKAKAQVSSVKSSLSSTVAAASICFDSGGEILGGVAGEYLCSLDDASGGTDAVWPLISVCGEDSADITFSVEDGNLDSWNYEISACAGSSRCVGAANALCSGERGGCEFSGTCE